MNVYEMERLVVQAKLGCIDSKEKIFFSFIPYINLLVSKFNISGYDREDLIQECYIVLHQAINKYKGCKTFISYVTKALKNNMIYLLRKSTKIQYSLIDNTAIIAIPTLITCLFPITIISTTSGNPINAEAILVKFEFPAFFTVSASIYIYSPFAFSYITFVILYF